MPTPDEWAQMPAAERAQRLAALLDGWDFYDSAATPKTGLAFIDSALEACHRRFLGRVAQGEADHKQIIKEELELLREELAGHLSQGGALIERVRKKR